MVMIQHKLLPLVLNTDLAYVILSLNLTVKKTIEGLAVAVYNNSITWDELNKHVVNSKRADVVLSRHLRGGLFTTFPTYKELSPVWLEAAQADVRRIWDYMYTAGEERETVLRDVVFNRSTFFGIYFTMHGKQHIRVYPTAELPDVLTKDNHVVIEVDDKFPSNDITIQHTGMVRGEIGFSDDVRELLNVTGVLIAYNEIDLEGMLSYTKSTYIPDST